MSARGPRFEGPPALPCFAFFAFAGGAIASLLLWLLPATVSAQVPENRPVAPPGRRQAPRLLDSRLLPSPQVSSDTPSSAFTSTAATSLSWSHTVGTNAGRLLLVGVSINAGTSVAGVTYGAQVLSPVGA